MIPLYILGMLLRYGPQHGYQIKKLIGEQLADFTDIKLPAIYYHLEKMEQAGYISAENQKEGERPEKRVYHINEPGVGRFRELLNRTLDIHYRPAFEVDSALFFSDHLDSGAFLTALEAHVQNLKRSLYRISEHQAAVVPYLPEDMRAAAALIFAHHMLHYQAELQWAEQAAATLKGVEGHDENQNS